MRFLEFVAVIGGADPEDPFEPNGKARHLAVGTLMLAIASWAFLAAMLAFHSNLHAPWPMAILGAALLASIVFLFDVIITVVPLKDDSVWSRVRVVLIRGILSLAVGVVVSHATILFIYRDDLATMVTDSNNKKIEQITNETTAASRWTQVITQAQAQIAKDQQRLSSEDAALDGARKRLDQLKAAWENDAVCVNGNLAANGDRCGQGPEANILKQAYESYRDSAFPQAQTSHDDTVKAVQADIDAQNKILNDANTQRGEEVTAATDAARHNLGLQAQNVALLQLLRADWTAWLWPLFFLLIDIAVAFMKGVLPESAFDLKRRTQAPVKTMIDAALTSPVPPKDSSPQLTAVLERAAARQAEVAIAGIDSWADRQLAARRNTAREWRRRPRRQRLRFAGATASLVVLAVVVSLIVSGSSGDNHAGPASSSDQSMQLRDGMTLSVPRGSISGSTSVRASYPAPSPWQDHAPVSQPVELSTLGQVVGAPELSIPVPEQLQHAAAAGGLQLAFRSADPTGWTTYPADYDTHTHRLSGRLTHFSTWQFWTWDWVGIGANVSQTLGQLTGRRSADQPQCDTHRHPKPAWFNTAAGVTNDAAMVIRSCVQGHDGDDTLDVQIVNNRPYGMMLLYSGAPIAYGWHETATALPSGAAGRRAGPSATSARRRPGPASAHSISRSGPTESNAALPHWPANTGAATFNNRVTALAASNRCRAGRNTASLAPDRARCRVPTSNPSTIKSTAGATRGATNTGTCSFNGRFNTFPRPNMKVSPMTRPIVAVTNRATACEWALMTDLHRGPKARSLPRPPTCRRKVPGQTRSHPSAILPGALRGASWTRRPGVADAEGDEAPGCGPGRSRCESGRPLKTVGAPAYSPEET
ncbi:DUF4407 domain-containing protein [Amycolatopsis sp. CA-126428]|uniref:DUF4407 domain-containing protein n=1 Tax=Amycolatopsis sp. CA-126428 TaxID=2073158 RepID=UPI001304F4A9